MTHFVAVLYYYVHIPLTQFITSRRYFSKSNYFVPGSDDFCDISVIYMYVSFLGVNQVPTSTGFINVFAYVLQIFYTKRIGSCEL